MSYSYYGGYRTRTFVDIFPDEATFSTFLSSAPSQQLSQAISATSRKTLYYLLYAEYGNSHIANSDENQFKYRLLSIIFMYGPTWEKRIEIQKAMRELTMDNGEKGIFRGSKAIHNTALNPGDAPSTDTLEELTFINQQNTTGYIKSPLDGYAELKALLERDVTKEFINKFRKLFITIGAADAPLLYSSSSLTDE